MTPKTKHRLDTKQMTYRQYLSLRVNGKQYYREPQWIAQANDKGYAVIKTTLKSK